MNSNPNSPTLKREGTSESDVVAAVVKLEQLATQPPTTRSVSNSKVFARLKVEIGAALSAGHSWETIRPILPDGLQQLKVSTLQRYLKNATAAKSSCRRRASSAERSGTSTPQPDLGSEATLNQLPASGTPAAAKDYDSDLM